MNETGLPVIRRLRNALKRWLPRALLRAVGVILRCIAGFVRSAGFRLQDRSEQRRPVLLFSVRQRNLLAIFDSVIDPFRRSEDVKVAFASLSRVDRRYMKGRYPKEQTFPSQAIQYMTLGKRRRVVTVIADMYSAAPRGALVANMFHNQPVKYAAFDESALRRVHTYFAWGEFQRDYICMLYDRSGIPTPDIRLTGCPMLDPLFKTHPEGEAHYKAKTLESMGLSPELPTVLYAPSWNSGLSLRKHGADLAQRLLSNRHMNVIIRLHPASMFPSSHPQFDFFTGGVKWAAELSRWQSEYGSFLDGSGFLDSVELLRISDLLVTDHSSIAWDFIALRKPVVHIHCEEFYEVATGSQAGKFGNPTRDQLLSDDFLNGGRSHGIVVESMSELSSTLETFANRGTLPVGDLEEISMYLLSNCGSASASVSETLREMLGVSP